MVDGATPVARRDRWRFMPIVDSLRSYDRGALRGDLVAGIAVAALIVPKNLGYAGIAGIPLQNGLYAAAAGAILYSVARRCSSPRGQSLSIALPVGSSTYHTPP
jgi:sulfate permease, SulP family